MWRSYDMVDFIQEQPERVLDRDDWVPEKTQEVPVRSWLLPRLAVLAETDRCERMVRIPPGFISC